MSILIKGMEMPENCASCDIACGFYLDLGVDGLLSKICRTESRRPDCPLVPVPEHGRLIDADNIGLTDFEIILCQKGNPFKNALEMLLEKIENAPTIIPAEEGE